MTALRSRFGDLHGHADLDRLAAEVLAGRLDPYAAADRILDGAVGATRTAARLTRHNSHMR